MCVCVYSDCTVDLLRSSHPPTFFGLDAYLRQIPFKFYMIQLILSFFEAIQCFSFLSNIQIFKSFKVSFIQASYSVWRQLFYKHSDLQIIQAFFYSRQLKYGVSLHSKIQILKSFKPKFSLAEYNK